MTIIGTHTTHCYAHCTPFRVRSCSPHCRMAESSGTPAPPPSKWTRGCTLHRHWKWIIIRMHIFFCVFCCMWEWHVVVAVNLKNSKQQIIAAKPIRTVDGRVCVSECASVWMHDNDGDDITRSKMQDNKLMFVYCWSRYSLVVSFQFHSMNRVKSARDAITWYSQPHKPHSPVSSSAKNHFLSFETAWLAHVFLLFLFNTRTIHTSHTKRYGTRCLSASARSRSLCTYINDLQRDALVQFIHSTLDVQHQQQQQHITSHHICVIEQLSKWRNHLRVYLNECADHIAHRPLLLLLIH